MTLDSEADPDEVALAVGRKTESVQLEGGLVLDPNSVCVSRQIAGRSRSLVLTGDTSLNQLGQLAYGLRDDLQAGLAVAVEDIEGAPKSRIEILADPDRLAAFNLAPVDLNAAIADALGTLEQSGQDQALPDIDSLAKIVI